MGLLKQFITFFDNFAAPVTLRSHGDSDKSSICTGFFSMLLVIFFGYIFVIKTLQILTFEQVSANSLVEDNVQHLKTGQVMFAMNVFEEHGKIVKNPYFEFQAFIFDKEEKILKNVTLKKCTLSQWSGVDTKILVDYYDIQNWFCPQKPVPIKGVRANDEMTSINLKIDFCLSSGWCKSRTDITNYIKNQKKTFGYMTAEFLIKDYGFTLNAENGTLNSAKYYKGTFTQTAGIVLDVWLAEYEIKTDTNFLPWQDYSTEKGTYVLEEKHFFSEYDADYNFLVECNIRFQSKTMMVERAFGKIDDVLSYAGGLMGLVVGFFAFFIGSYNEYKYELSIAEDSFCIDEKGSKMGAKDMGFFMYVGYVTYDWFKTLITEPNWKYMKKLDEVREEAGQQININLLCKKIQYLQKLCKYNLTSEEAKCLAIMNYPQIDQVRKKRMFLTYYDCILSEANFDIVLLQDIYPGEIQCSEEAKKEKLNNLTLEELKSVILTYKVKNLEIFQYVESIELDEDMQQVQKQLAEAFCELPQEKRGPIQSKYPVVILFCLMACKNLIKDCRTLLKVEAVEEMSAQNFIGTAKVAPLDISRNQMIK